MRMPTRRLAVLVLLCALPLSGCASRFSNFVVQTRVRQGDLALAHGNITDAELAYKLALDLAPHDPQARSGFALAQLKLAYTAYHDSRFEDAMTALAIAARYDPQSVRLAELRSDIEQARVKREIVLSNYPSYRETGLQLRRAYLQLRKVDGGIVSGLQKFDYTYDTDSLTKAIQDSSLFATEVAKLTNRLISFRQLVESGAPQPRSAAGGASGSLLPLP